VTQPWWSSWQPPQAAIPSAPSPSSCTSLLAPHTSAGLLLGASFPESPHCSCPVQLSQPQPQPQSQSQSQLESQGDAAAAAGVFWGTTLGAQGQPNTTTGASAGCNSSSTSGTPAGAPVHSRPLPAPAGVRPPSKPSSRTREVTNGSTASGACTPSTSTPCACSSQLSTSWRSDFGEGDSLHLWLSAFPKGKIYGLEYNPAMQAIVQKNPKLRSRVKVFSGDQANATLLKGIVRVVKRQVGLLDFIVDDGGTAWSSRLCPSPTSCPSSSRGGLLH